MAAGPIDLITIAREYGSGGSDLAAQLGARLGWPVLDDDLVRRVAERLHLDPGAVRELDEHPPTFLARIATAMLIAPPEMAMPPHTREVLRPDAVAEAAQAAILAAAEAPPVIIVGHGGASIFAGRPGTLHLRLVAPLDDRARRIAVRTGWSEREAAAEARRVDEDRARYVSRYYHASWRDPLLYHLVLNTSRISLDEAAALVEQIVVRQDG
jgi:cytidylate kinase